MPGLTGPDTPPSLKDACDIYFSGRIRVATLKAEQQRGNLEIYKIGRQYFTTFCHPNVHARDSKIAEAHAWAALAAIKLWREALKAANKKGDG